MLKHLLFLFLGCCSLLLPAQRDSVLRFAMSTPWSETVSPTQPWDVYPRPQLTRANWTNLNGQWDYAITPMTAAAAPSRYEGKILVPFAVESALSGVKDLVDENEYLWYHRSFASPQMGAEDRLLIHFGAVDFRATVYLNGQVVGGHQGGYTSFSFDLTPYLAQRGQQELVVRVSDPTDKGLQPRGKQVQDPGGIFYTPVTGIWQTTWLEVVPKNYISGLKTTPHLSEGTLDVAVQTNSSSEDLTATVTLTGEGGTEVTSQSVDLMAGGRGQALQLEVPDAHPWSPEDPFLYQLEVTLSTPDGRVVDRVGSYAGMRDISLGKDANGHTAILLNGLPYFQFGPLDQGYWPDGLYTAPTAEAMVFDLEMTKKWGFNMLRKHVKVEPATFYYACDTLGLLVWQDMPSGYIQARTFVGPEDVRDADQPYADAVHFEQEYHELIDQLYDFPSIVTWVPFNEGWGQFDTERIAAWTKAYDPSRLVDAPSGWTDRGVGDMYDVHIYPGPGMERPEDERASVLGEFGGLGYPVPDHLWWDKRNWGYRTLQSQEELTNGFAELMDGLQGTTEPGLIRRHLHPDHRRRGRNQRPHDLRPPRHEARYPALARPVRPPVRTRRPLPAAAGYLRVRSADLAGNGGGEQRRDGGLPHRSVFDLQRLLHPRQLPLERGGIPYAPPRIHHRPAAGRALRRVPQQPGRDRNTRQRPAPTLSRPEGR